jgi:hypothetical protein
MRKFATTDVIDILSRVSASALGHGSERLLYKPLHRKDKVILCVHHSPNHLISNHQGLS